VADRVTMALARARAVLDSLVPERTAKRIWGSPAGKTHLAQRIVAEIPEHRVYVEPFAGGAQVLFAKEPSEVEVVGDLDPEIAFAFRFAKNLTAEQLDRLRRKKCGRGQGPLPQALRVGSAGRRGRSLLPLRLPHPLLVQQAPARDDELHPAERTG